MNSPLFRSKKIAVFILVLGELLGVACSNGLIKTFTGLNAIRQQLIEKYHDDVNINLTNSSFLSVVFINSPLNKIGESARLERAQEVARFVALNYEGIKSIQEIWVAFQATKSYFGVFHKTEGLGAFGFDRNGKLLGPDSEKETDARIPIVKFNEARNETDVSLTWIPLEGDMNDGIALTPHFTVSGDASQNAAPAPELVTLDFASYAREPRFKDNPGLEIYCDERLILKGPVQLMPAGASGAKENIAQFLTVRISFKSFKKMAGARNVRINLADYSFELSPDDIGALAAMVSHVTPGSAATSAKQKNSDLAQFSQGFSCVAAWPVLQCGASSLHQARAASPLNGRF